MSDDAVKAAPPNYSYSLAFDRTKFLTGYVQRFSKSPRYNAGATQSLLDLLTQIEKDSRITDIRWAAYMLATTAWETTSPTRVERPAHTKKGKPILDKTGKPVMTKSMRWLNTMAPVEEVGHGRGRRYSDPVKVKLLADGSARITEHDGDQFSISVAGTIKKLTKKAVMGSTYGAAVADAYTKDDGVEGVFYGRGFVQLTWWSNYAKAGVRLGRGLDLLVHPDLVKEVGTAYQVMATGMLTGTIFANGHKFADYFSGSDTHYEKARKMVNGSDHAADIAAIARLFEAVLLESKGIQL